MYGKLAAGGSLPAGYSRREAYVMSEMDKKISEGLRFGDVLLFLIALQNEYQERRGTNCWGLEGAVAHLIWLPGLVDRPTKGLTHSTGVIGAVGILDPYSDRYAPAGAKVREVDAPFARVTQGRLPKGTCQMPVPLTPLNLEERELTMLVAIRRDIPLSSPCPARSIPAGHFSSMRVFPQLAPGFPLGELIMGDDGIGTLVLTERIDPFVHTLIRITGGWRGSDLLAKFVGLF